MFLQKYIDNAKNRYERVIRINPDHVDAWLPKKGKPVPAVAHLLQIYSFRIL